MKKILLFSLLMTSLFGTNVVNAQDDEENDRPVRRKDRKHGTHKVKSIYGINLMHITEDNVGFAISYERFLDKNGIVSLYLPLSYSLAQQQNYYTGGYYYYGYNPYQHNPTEVYTYSNGMATFYPGIKIYPGGAHKKVTYALGSSLVFGVGSVNKTTFTYRLDSASMGGYNRVLDKRNTEDVSQFKLGMLITNHLNIRPGRYYFGLEFGVGYTYLNSIDGVEADRTALVQFGIKMGLTR